MSTPKALQAYALALVLLALGCATKVGNPENDNDQDDDDPKDFIVLDPIGIQFTSLPDVSKLEVDEAFKDFFVDTFTLIDVSNRMIGQLNAFFSLVNEKQLAREGLVSLEKDGIRLAGRSWRTEDRNGVYFCDGPTRVFHITWDADDIVVYRDLKQAVPVTGDPMTDGLGAMIDARFDNAKGSLAVTYSGRYRDPATKKDTSRHIAFHYDAYRPDGKKTDYSGIYAETDAEGKIPADADRRMIGTIDETSKGSALAHLTSLCPKFDETAIPRPEWCAAVTHDAETIDVSLTGSDIDATYESLERIAPPKYESLEKVDFPSDMTCPATPED